MAVLIDKDFYDTGWNKIPFSHIPEPGSEIAVHIDVTSTGDGWDRLGAIALNGCEILRFATPFDSALRQTVTIGEPVASAFRYPSGEAVLTTYAAGGGGWHMKITYESRGSPSYYGIPVWFLEEMNPEKRSLKARIDAYADYLVLNITGHSYEEGAYRTFELLADGETIWEDVTGDRWNPNVFVSPMVFEVKRRIGEVELRSPDCRSYWKVSLWAASPTPPVEWPSLLLGLTPILMVGGVVACEELGKRI